MSGSASKRCEIPSFKVMDVLKAAQAKEAELKASNSPHGLLHLEIGQPSTGAPKKVKEAAVQALEADKLGYTDAFGVPALREKLASSYMAKYGVKVEQDDVIITTGSSGAFVVAFTACFDPGMRVAMAAPGYPCYRNILQALGVEVVSIPVGPDTNYQPTTEMLKAVSPIDGVIIASPSNPTGTVLSEEELGKICKYCKESGIRLISDEIYHGITLDDKPAQTALKFDPNTVIINSFSKYYSMTGWRLGWIIAKDPKLKKGLEVLLQNLFISAPTLSQLAGLAAFDATEELEDHVTRYRQNKAILLEGLPKAGFTELSNPQGAFYIYCHVPDLLKKTGCSSSLELGSKILEECAVAVTPGLDFDVDRGQHYIRFSFAGSTAAMQEACERLQMWYKGLPVSNL